jgi:hypothetical protein
MTKIKRGRSAVRLVQYLYGPGRHNEHKDPHLVAGWDSFVPDPGRDASTSAAFLADLLEVPVTAYAKRRGKKPARPVWHTIVSNPQEDRPLTDAEWGAVARRMVAAAGVAPADDDQAVRWIAVRHGVSSKGNDHIHIVATLVRQDGRVAKHHNDAAAMRRESWACEEELGLRSTRRQGDRTATARPTRAELEKGRRLGLEGGEGATIRGELAAKVRSAAVAARDEADFFARLASAGLRVKRRVLPSGTVAGYSVAKTGDRTQEGEPVYFSGSTLAPDLSLPRLRGRWGATVPKQAPMTWESAAEVLARAEAMVRASSDPQEVGAIAARVGDVVTALISKDDPWYEAVSEASRAYERAGRLPREVAGGYDDDLTRALQRVAWMAASGRGSDAGMVLVLFALVLLVIAIEWWLARQVDASGNPLYPAQASAARHGLGFLRVASQQAVGRASRGGARQHPVRGDAVAAAAPDLRAAVVRAVPGHARAVFADPTGWPVLAAQLRRLEQRGEDPVAVLAEVAGQRGLSDARGVAEVLAWRLERWMAGERRALMVRPVSAPGGVSVPRSRAEAAALTSSAPGRAVVETEEVDYAPMVRAQLTGLAGEAVLSDAVWPALAQQLARVDAGGDDAAAVLAEVVTARELETAESIAQVLRWRLQGRLGNEQTVALGSSGSGSRRVTTSSGPRVSRTRPPAAEPGSSQGR